MFVVGLRGGDLEDLVASEEGTNTSNRNNAEEGDE